MSFDIWTKQDALARARRLRNQMTDAEKRLWDRLRARQIGRQQFRKQVPFGPYVADFCCLKARLIIEVDGGQHASATGADDRRTAWLKQHDYRVLRFWNNEVLSNMDGVVETIASALKSTTVEP